MAGSHLLSGSLENYRWRWTCSRPRTPHATLEPTKRPETIFGRQLQLLQVAKEAFAHVDGSQQVRAVLLRRSVPQGGPYLHSSMRRNCANGGRWIGLARVLGSDGRSLVWLVRTGVPMTALLESLRRAAGKEALSKRELELRPSRKRRRDVELWTIRFKNLVGVPTGAGGLGEPQHSFPSSTQTRPIWTLLTTYLTGLPTSR